MSASAWHLRAATEAALRDALGTPVQTGVADGALLLDVRGSVIIRVGNLPVGPVVDTMGTILAAAWAATRAQAKHGGARGGQEHAVAPGHQSYSQEGSKRGILCLNVTPQWLAVWLYQPSATGMNSLALHTRSSVRRLAEIAHEASDTPTPAAVRRPVAPPPPSAAARSLTDELLDDGL